MSIFIYLHGYMIIMFLIDFVSTFIFKIYKVYLFYIISLVYNMVRVGSYVCAGWYLNLPAVCILYITIKPMVAIHYWCDLLSNVYVTGNSATQGIALFPENISGNSATRCYILDNYSIITERRYIKICNHMYFLTRNILAQILFLSDVRFRRYLTIDKITLLTTRIPHFVNCQISSEP